MPPFAKVPHTRLLLLNLALAAPATIAQGIEIPAAWQGVWATETEIRACGQAPVLFVESESDTLCAGDILYAEDGISEECTGTVSDTDVDVTCVFSEDFGGGCTLTVTIHLVATRDGDDYTAVETWENDFSGTCSPEFQDSCLEYTSAGTRTGDEPNCEQVASATSSWSLVKSRFR